MSLTDKEKIISSLDSISKAFLHQGDEVLIKNNYSLKAQGFKEGLIWAAKYLDKISEKIKET